MHHSGINNINFGFTHTSKCVSTVYSVLYTQAFSTGRIRTLVCRSLFMVMIVQKKIKIKNTRGLEIEKEFIVFETTKPIASMPPAPGHCLGLGALEMFQ